MSERPVGLIVMSQKKTPDRVGLCTVVTCYFFFKNATISELFQYTVERENCAVLKVCILPVSLKNKVT